MVIVFLVTMVFFDPYIELDEFYEPILIEFLFESCDLFYVNLTNCIHVLLTGKKKKTINYFENYQDVTQQMYISNDMVIIIQKLVYQTILVTFFVQKTMIYLLFYETKKSKISIQFLYIFCCNSKSSTVAAKDRDMYIDLWYCNKICIKIGWYLDSLFIKIKISWFLIQKSDQYILILYN